MRLERGLAGDVIGSTLKKERDFHDFSPLYWLLVSDFYVVKRSTGEEDLVNCVHAKSSCCQVSRLKFMDLDISGTLRLCQIVHVENVF